MAKVRSSNGTILLEGRPVAYRLYRMPRRKHVHLVVSADGVLQIRVPYWCSQMHAEAALRENGTWALEALERARDAVQARPSLGEGSELPLLDERLRLGLMQATRASVRREGEEVVVAGPDLQPGFVRSSLSVWYRGQARDYLGGRVACLAPRLGVVPSRLNIRGQKTRWGSCSSRGTVSLNWRLMLTPAELADYVVVHELCHLRHLNHSPEFWRFVATFVPDWQARRMRLRVMQGELPL